MVGTKVNHMLLVWVLFLVQTEFNKMGAWPVCSLNGSEHDIYIILLFLFEAVLKKVFTDGLM